MRKRVSRRTVLLLVAGFVLAALVLTGVASTGKLRATAQPGADDGAKSLAASYQAAGTHSGANEGASATTEGLQSARAELINKSSVIVVGTALSNKSRLSANGEEVRTYYKVRVKEVLKGSVQSGGVIALSMRGGLVLLKGDGSEVSENNRLKGEAAVKVQVSDQSGTDGLVPLEGVASTRITPPEFTQPMTNGQTYVIFLVKKADGWAMIGEPQEAGNAQSLIEEIRSAVQQQ